MPIFSKGNFQCTYGAIVSSWANSIRILLNPAHMVLSHIWCRRTYGDVTHMVPFNHWEIVSWSALKQCWPMPLIILKHSLKTAPRTQRKGIGHLWAYCGTKEALAIIDSETKIRSGYQHQKKWEKAALAIWPMPQTATLTVRTVHI